MEPAKELTAYTIQQTPSICKILQNKPTTQMSDQDYADMV